MLAWDGDSSHAIHVRSSAGAELVLSGRVESSRQFLRQQLDARASSFKADAITGEFSGVAVWVGDGGGAVVRGFSDRVACGPLYFGEKDGRAVVSNDPQFVGIALGVGRLSEVGAYELLTYNHSLGSETTIEGVFRLFPGEKVDFVVDGRRSIRASVEGSNPIRYRTREMGDDEHMVETYKVLVDGVRHNKVLSDNRDTSSLGISGGLDSRLTLAAVAEALGANGRALTLDLSDERETSIGGEVARILGFEHETVSLERSGVETLRAGWLLTGGQVSAHAAAGNVLFYEVAGAPETQPCVIVGAWPGDCLIGSYVPIARSMIKRRWTTIGVRAWSRNRGRQWISTEAGEFRGRAVRALIRQSRARLRLSVMASSGSTAAQKISHWAMFRRQPAFSYVAPSVLCSDVLSVTPVLAPKYLDHLMELGAEDILGKNYYRRLLYSQIPALRDVPLAVTGEPVSIARKRPGLVPTAFDLFAVAPPLLRNWARLLYRRVVVGETALTAHWSSLLIHEFGSVRKLEFGNVTFDFSKARDTQVLGNALSLWWTQLYLAEAKGTLG